MDPNPIPDGTPVRVDDPVAISVRDRLLVEWVAQAKVGDPLPPPWSDSQSPLESVVRTLIMLGVIERPDPGTSLASVARAASAAARGWLEANLAEPVRATPELITPPWADRERLGGSAVELARQARETPPRD